MLKISVNRTSDLVTLKLEGKLAGPWDSELERVWRSFLSSDNCGDLRLDLRNVDFVDKEGRTLLRQMHLQSGATFLADSPLTQYYAEEASHDFPQRLRRAN
jgi:hypothetical protein